MGGIIAEHMVLQNGSMLGQEMNTEQINVISCRRLQCNLSVQREEAASLTLTLAHQELLKLLNLLSFGKQALRRCWWLKTLNEALLVDPQPLSL